MSFPAYPAYKKSDVEWLGEVPEHWILTPLKHLALLNPRKPGYDGDTERLCSFVPMEKLKTGVVQLDEERPISEVIGGYTYFEDGDVLQAKVTPCFENKNIAIAKGLTNGVGFGSSEINVLRPYQGINAKYLYYRVQEDSYMAFCTSSMIGAGGLKRVPTDVINNFKVATPEVFEQIQIAYFLDHETARIDALIEEQQRLIALLKEKRQAVISHAVTKGLDPTVPMKDSGVEWLGDVPEHWGFGKIRYFAKIESGHTPSRSKPEYWENCTIPWFSLADVWQIRSGEVIELFETKELVSEFGLANSSARLLPKGTVVLSRTASVGYSAIMGCDMATTQDFANWICGSKLNNTFLLFCFRAMKSEFGRLMMGSTHKTIYMPDIAELVCSVPPLDEQEEIATHIKISNSKFGNMIDEAERMKKLLTERRSVLISAAVTGKIDVRGWRPPASAPTPELVKEAV